MRNRRWLLAYLICAAAAALPFLATYRMPMADLPQHAAQITFWKFFHDRCYHFDAVYDFNWFTPYVLGYAPARILSAFVTVNTALKLVTYLSILLFVWMTRRITDFAGLDPAVALLAFPLGFGFAFYWGFSNFLVTLPFGLAFILASLRLTEAPARRLWLVAAGSFLLAASHALVFLASAGLAAIAHAMTATERRARLWPGLAAILAAAPPFLGWALYNRAHEPRARNAMLWGWHPTRPLEFLSDLFSPGGDGKALIAASIAVGLIVLSGVSITHDRTRRVLAGLALLAYLAGPHSAFGQIFLYQRFAVFAFVVALLGLEAGKPRLRRELVLALVLALVIGWMSVLTIRFREFHRDADGFDRLVDALPTNQRLLLINVMPQSITVPGTPFLHFSGYYQERSGGRIGWSFSSNFPTVFRFRRGVANLVPPGATYDPEQFRPEYADAFDAVVVRAPTEMSQVFFPGFRGGMRLDRRAGLWWLYRRRLPLPPVPACPPLERTDPSDRRRIL